MAQLSLGLSLSLGCAASGGWEVSERISCPIAERRVLCVDASPDLGSTFEVGGARVLPGECVAPGEDAPASVRVEVDSRRRRVRVPAGSQTEVRLEDGRRMRVRRLRCPS